MIFDIHVADQYGTLFHYHSTAEGMKIDSSQMDINVWAERLTSARTWIPFVSIQTNYSIDFNLSNFKEVELKPSKNVTLYTSIDLAQNAPNFPLSHV